MGILSADLKNNMSQKNAWEREYKDPSLVSRTFEPTKDAKDFARFLRKHAALEGARVLDMGSGIGKNAHFFAEREASVTGVEISETAIALAKKRAKQTGVFVEYIQGDIGKILPFHNGLFDAAFDILSSNSLSERERATYLSETHRILKQGGYFLIKALAKDGDKNARTLLSKYPGKEKDTYTIPKTSIVERIFSEADLRTLYKPYFDIVSLKKTSHYPRIGGRLYKRNYFVVILQNLANT